MQLQKSEVQRDEPYKNRGCPRETLNPKTQVMKKLNTQLFRIIWVLCSTNQNPNLLGECKNLTLGFERKEGFSWFS